MTVSYITAEESECVIDQALSTKTLDEIEHVAQALREWIKQHPDDLSAEDALEPLAIRRNGILSQRGKTVARAS
jgi:hypothetical protein